MIVRIASGIHGLDELTSSDDELGLGLGGLPENSSTLVYGPPDVGKSVFCCGYAYHGLTQDEPCLYLTADQSMQEFLDRMSDLGDNIRDFMDNGILYIVDAASDVKEGEFEGSETEQHSSVRNPTDILVKVSMGARYISKKNPRFRSVIDSITTILESNNEMLIVRVLKTYLMRVKELGGTAVISYTEGSTDSRTEIIIKSMVDNIIRLDGEKLTIEAMRGIGKRESNYKVTEKGINIL